MSSRKSSGESYGKGRTRDWTFLVYPDSAPENWRTVLDEFNVPWVESPLHDKDVNPDGELKKSHWHILICFDSVKTFEQVCEITVLLNAPIPKKCLSKTGLIRYMVHLDNPEKFQYDLLDIVPHQGADIGQYFLPSRTQKIAYTHEIFEWIEENNILYFDVLLDYARKYKPDTWYVCLLEHYSIVLSKYFSHRRIRHEQGNI